MGMYENFELFDELRFKLVELQTRIASLEKELARIDTECPRQCRCPVGDLAKAAPGGA